MRKKTIRMAGLLCLLCICAGAIIVYRAYNKPHRSAATETAVELTAMRLAAEYEKNEADANKKYLGNAVQVSGTVSEVSFNQQNKPVIVLLGADMSGVQCTLQGNALDIKKGDSITIKGFCTGYLTDVIMDRCIVGR
ncbi:MAG: hypothetical protein ABJC98_09900, partial [Bacteroidota bacterium]